MQGAMKASPSQFPRQQNEIFMHNESLIKFVT